MKYYIKFTFKNGKSIIESYKTAKECKNWIEYTAKNSSNLKVIAERHFL